MPRDMRVPALHIGDDQGDPIAVVVGPDQGWSRKAVRQGGRDGRFLPVDRGRMLIQLLADRFDEGPAAARRAHPIRNARRKASLLAPCLHHGCAKDLFDACLNVNGKVSPADAGTPLRLHGNRYSFAAEEVLFADVAGIHTSGVVVVISLNPASAGSAMDIDED